eukprot:1035192-Prorocentrum_minimum.AAC.1
MGLHVRQNHQVTPFEGLACVTKSSRHTSWASRRRYTNSTPDSLPTCTRVFAGVTQTSRPTPRGARGCDTNITPPRPGGGGGAAPAGLRGDLQAGAGGHGSEGGACGDDRAS